MSTTIVDEQAEKDGEQGPSRRMLLTLAVIVLVGGGLMLVMTPSSRLVDSDTPAPPFELSTLTGEPVSLESLQGKVVVLDFWATTCPPCMRQMVELDQLRERHPEDEVVILGINSEGQPPELIRGFLRDRGKRPRYPTLHDLGAVAAAYQVSALPTLYVIDEEGVIRWSRTGLTGHRELHEVIQGL